MSDPSQPLVDDRRTFSADELLASHPMAEPLIVAGVRCHGGFDDTGTYRSPRTLHRSPAIAAWQSEHARVGGAPLIDLALDDVATHYPNVSQARFLIEAGAPEPIVSILTRIGTVEGFGGYLRYVTVPEMQPLFADPVAGTATAHLSCGLVEAHARDESGWDDEAGHDRMWFAARDLAFDHPVTQDQTALMLERMGITGPGGQVPDLVELRRIAIANRKLPDDIDFDLEALVDRLMRLLLIEISAFHTFRWAEELLGDPELVAGDGEAARIVSHIRADETPHVEYLRTTLSEMRDRTWLGHGGARHDGAELISTMWDAAVADSTGPRRHDVLELTWREVRHAVAEHPHRDDLLDQFDALGDVHRDTDGAWHNTDRTAA
jgi:hypothetical protein